jgi:hypothetical protein
MLQKYHVEITRRALQEAFSQAALEAIIAANLEQDSWRGLLWHPEYHFDNNRFRDARAFVRAQREAVLLSLESVDFPAAWAAFGRLTHAVQDFYAHSNYVKLWVEIHGCEGGVGPEDIDPTEQALLDSPVLRSGQVYYLGEFFAKLSLLEPLVERLWPADAHIHMNLDQPERGALFAYAFQAARKRTRLEFEIVAALLSPAALEVFTGMPGERQGSISG